MPINTASSFLHDISRYFLIGGTAACVNFGIFWLLDFQLGLHYLLASATGFVVATGVNYWLCIRFLFVAAPKNHRSREIILVYLVSLMGLAIQELVLYVLVTAADAKHLIAQAVAMGCAFFWNFFARKLWVFRSTVT